VCETSFHSYKLQRHFLSFLNKFSVSKTIFKLGWVIWGKVSFLKSIFYKNDIRHVNLFFDGLSNGELLTFKTGPPCIVRWDFKNTTPKHCAPNYDAMKLDKYKFKDVHTLVIKFEEFSNKSFY